MTKSKSMDKSDFEAATKALMNWFQSQEIGMADAVTIMVAAMSFIFGHRAKSKHNLANHIGLTAVAMTELSIIAFEEKHPE